MIVNQQLMEHRWGTRIHLDAPAELRTARGVVAEATIRNASISGAFIQTDLLLPLLSQVSVRAAGSTDEWLDGCVVRVDEDGLAMEWLDPGLQAVSALLALRRDSTLHAAMPFSDDQWRPDSRGAFLLERHEPLQP